MRNDTWNDVAQLPGPQHDGDKGLNLSAWTSALRALPVLSVAENDVLEWVEGPLRLFFPFEKFLGFYGRVFGGYVQIRSLMTSGYPAEFVSALGRGFDLNERACVAWWLSNGKPFILHQSVMLNEVGNPIITTPHELDEVNRFSLGPIAAHGVVDRFADTGTHICFAGAPIDQPEKTFAALRLIAPVLHTLLLQAKRPEEFPVNLAALTGRQRDLVDLALKGFPDKTIAKRLAISEHTVGNHFRAIYSKLGISKRSQLITLLR